MCVPDHFGISAMSLSIPCAEKRVMEWGETFFPLEIEQIHAICGLIIHSGLHQSNGGADARCVSVRISSGFQATLTQQIERMSMHYGRGVYSSISLFTGSQPYSASFPDWFPRKWSVPLIVQKMVLFWWVLLVPARWVLPVDWFCHNGWSSFSHSTLL